MNYLIGAGGHASVIEDIAGKNNFPLDGVFYDGNVKNLTQLEQLGSIQDIKEYIDGNHLMIAFGDINSRIKLAKFLKEHNAKWFTLVDPTASVSSEVTIGEGTVIMPNAVVNAGAKIGNHVIINSGSVIEHGCVIEDYVHVSPGSTICGNAIIRSGSWIGAGSVVIGAIEIGENCVVGAGSVVIRNIDSNTKVAGNPAKILKK